jgi:4-hydroxy-tetrahydrodipicolinate reductase
MGRTVIKAIAETGGVVLAGAIEAPGAGVIGRDTGELAGLGPNGIMVSANAPALFAKADGLVDFTIPAATMVLAEQSAAHGLVHVIGTTGFASGDEKIIAAAAGQARIVKSGNMSLGVNLLGVLTRKVAQALGEEFDIEIFEMHHNKKIDAPSGTALLFGEAAAAGRGIELAAHSERGRDGHTGARKPGNIGFASLRGGNVAGDHSVIFAGADERIELTHKATDRMIFARGALKAAQWIRGKPPGLYNMLDVLGLRD